MTRMVLAGFVLALTLCLTTLGISEAQTHHAPSGLGVNDNSSTLPMNPAPPPHPIYSYSLHGKILTVNYVENNIPITLMQLNSYRWHDGGLNPGYFAELSRSDFQVILYDPYRAIVRCINFQVPINSPSHIVRDIWDFHELPSPGIPNQQLNWVRIATEINVSWK
jgi:hypothetical protein